MKGFLLQNQALPEIHLPKDLDLNN